jgi:flagellin-like hook-associated protein FlgL
VDPYSAILNASGVDDPNGDDTFSWREGTLKKILILVTDTNNEANYHSPPQTEATTAATMLNSGIEVHSITNQTAPYNDITTGTGGSQGDLSDMAPTDPDNPLVGAGNIADQLVLELQNQTGGGVRQIGIFNTSNDRVTTPVPVDVTPINLDLADTNISTVDDAGDAMDKLEAAMDNVNSLRAGIGAYQRRLDSIMSSNIQTTETELGAVSTMTDANIAEEVASKMKASMKAQAASTILMQAKKLQRNSIEQLLG